MSLKDALKSPPVHTLLRPNGQLTPYIDTCCTQIGCVAFQRKENGGNRAAGSRSRTLNEEEQTLATTHRWYMANRCAIMNIFFYLKGSAYEIRTKSETLRWILNVAGGTGKLGQWRLRSSACEFDIIRRADINI